MILIWMSPIFCLQNFQKLNVVKLWINTIMPKAQALNHTA